MTRKEQIKSAYKMTGGNAGFYDGMIIDGMKCYTAEEIEAALRTAGFSEIKAVHHPQKPWLAVVGRK